MKLPSTERSTTTPGHLKRTIAAVGENHLRCTRRKHVCLLWVWISSMCSCSLLCCLCRKTSLTSNIPWNCHRILKSPVISSEIQPSVWSIAAHFRTPGQSAWIFRLCPFPSKQFFIFFILLIKRLQSIYLLRVSREEIRFWHISKLSLTGLICVYSETLMRVHDLDATVKMLLYTDETYTNPIVASPVIELGEKVSKCCDWLNQMCFFSLKLISFFCFFLHRCTWRW